MQSEPREGGMRVELEVQLNLEARTGRDLKPKHKTDRGTQTLDREKRIRPETRMDVRTRRKRGRIIEPED